MPVDQEMAQKWVDYLNSVLEFDRKAITELLNFRTPCNQHLENHPTVQVQVVGGGPARVGFIGILNGIVGTFDSPPRKGWGSVAYEFDDKSGKIKRFLLLKNELPNPTPPQPLV